MAYRYLIDTNLLVYPQDGREREKGVKARNLLARLGATDDAVVPAQALAEFADVLLRKMEPPVEPDTVLHQVEDLLLAFPILPLTPLIVLEAVRGVRDHGFSYFDAQIWGAARLNQIPVVLSEDFQSGASLEGVRFLDPLVPDFELGWL
ncbi:MAG: PIN domain-containing protein [Gemmatimonadetes bacterium]|nr:PIN domain-containing protein [Gemmatimonadota bacterium]